MVNTYYNMNLQENISTQLRRRTHLLDRVIDNLLPNMYPCDYNSSDHFVEGVIDEIRWFLLDVEELQGIERADIVYYIIDYKYDELTEYFNERCIVLQNDNLQESIRRILREELNVLPNVLYHSVTSEDARDFVLKNGIKADSNSMVYLSEKPITTKPYKYSFKVKVPDMTKLWDWRDIWSDGDDKEYDMNNPYYVYEGDIDKQYITLKKHKKNLREETRIPPIIRRRLTNSDIEEAFLKALDLMDYKRNSNQFSPIKNVSLDRFAKLVIDEMVTSFEQDYFNDNNRIYFDNDEKYHDEIRVPLMNYFGDRIKERYNERQGINESILREETSSQDRMKNTVSEIGLINAKKMIGGIDNLYKVLGFTGTQEEMIFIVDALMKHDVPILENICDFRIVPTKHSLKLYVEIPKYYSNLADDSWANRQRVLRARDNISTIIHKLGNNLVKGHTIDVSLGKC